MSSTNSPWFTAALTFTHTEVHLTIDQLGSKPDSLIRAMDDRTEELSRQYRGDNVAGMEVLMADSQWFKLQLELDEMCRQTECFSLDGTGSFNHAQSDFSAEVFNNFLLLKSPSAWQALSTSSTPEYACPTIGEMWEGEFKLSNVTAVAIRGPQDSIMAAIWQTTKVDHSKTRRDGTLLVAGNGVYFDEDTFETQRVGMKITTLSHLRDNLHLFPQWVSDLDLNSIHQFNQEDMRQAIRYGNTECVAMHAVGDSRLF